jgi:hypothetical protein
MAARLSVLRAGRFLPPGKFMVIISVRGWVDPRAIVRLEGLGKLKKYTPSGTRTGDLPACSIVSQPTTLPRATPALYILLTFQVPNLISIFFRLGRLSKESVQVRGFLWSFVTGLFSSARPCHPTPNTQAGGSPLVGCPRLLIQYILSYPQHLAAVSSICNLRTRHAVVTITN